MKRFLKILLLLCVLAFVGELCSSPKTIVRQENGMNVWQVNHLFNLCKTEYTGPPNDTAQVVVIDKNKTNRSRMVHVSDGNTVTLLKSRQIYDYVEVGETINLVTTNEPVNKHKYTIKYTVFK